MARESLIPCEPLFPDVAGEAWERCSNFVMADVAGQPTFGDVALPWIKDFVLTVFGAEDPESGRRHINEFLLMVSKKNGKSSIAAAIMLTALLMNWRPSAELLILSPTKEIADNSYKPIRDFIKADDELQSILKVQDYFRTITHLETGATLKVVAADIVEDDIDSLRSQRLQLIPDRSSLVINSMVVACFLRQPCAFFCTSGNADDGATRYTGQLSYNRSRRTGSARGGRRNGGRRWRR